MWSTCWHIIINAYPKASTRAAEYNLGSSSDHHKPSNTSLDIPLPCGFPMSSSHQDEVIHNESVSSLLTVSEPNPGTPKETVLLFKETFDLQHYTDINVYDADIITEYETNETDLFDINSLPIDTDRFNENHLQENYPTTDSVVIYSVTNINSRVNTETESLDKTQRDRRLNMYENTTFPTEMIEDISVENIGDANVIVVPNCNTNIDDIEQKKKSNTPPHTAKEKKNKSERDVKYRYSLSDFVITTCDAKLYPSVITDIKKNSTRLMQWSKRWA
ncbi:hypothetical protein FQR65_LT11727 [Abscondita terminalis]|nr:hypothetical protein FQR65_LT11727 [Abscondita terminalis]